MANACKLIGHRYRYTVAGSTVHWLCVRGCGETGSAVFATVREARRYAAARNRSEQDAKGRWLTSVAPWRGLAARLRRR
jgi:hypothetical protein